MAVTRIADVIVPAVFNPYVLERTAELSALQAAGIVSSNPELDALATAGGKYINMPFWTDLDGDDELLSDSVALTPGKIDASQDVAALLMRGRAWASNDLAKALSGDDPMGAIADLVAAYWARRRQATLINTLRGVFASASMASNLHDIGSEAAASGKGHFTGQTFIDATQKMGDAKEKLVACVMHSAVEAELAKQNLIAFERNSEGQVMVRRYMGYQVIVDDGCPIEVRDIDPTAAVDNRNVYTTYLFGEGAIGLGNGAAPVPTETDRDSLAGDDILVNRQHFLLHPRGVKFNAASVAGSSPTNAELALASNWTRVYEPKNVRMVMFKHRLGA